MPDAFCTNCGTALEPGDAFCSNCGTAVEGEVAVVAPAPAAVSVCPNCGDPIEEGEAFCTVCGTDLGAATAQTAAAPVPGTPPATQPVEAAVTPVTPTQPVPAAAVETPLPEGQFKAEGVWWFRKGDRLMMFEGGQWVDATRTPVMGAPAPAATGPRFGPLIGAAAVALSAFLGWFTFPGVPDIDTFDFGISALFDISGESADSGLDVGWVLLAVAAAAAAFSFRTPMSLQRRICGAAALAVAGLFVYQVMSSLSDLGPTAPPAFDVLGIGVFLSLAGGIVLALDR